MGWEQTRAWDRVWRHLRRPRLCLPSVPALAPWARVLPASPATHRRMCHQPAQGKESPLPSPFLSYTLSPNPQPFGSSLRLLPASLPGWAILEARAWVWLSTRILEIIRSLIHSPTTDKAVNERVSAFRELVSRGNKMGSKGNEAMMKINRDRQWLGERRAALEDGQRGKRWPGP